MEFILEAAADVKGMLTIAVNYYCINKNNEKPGCWQSHYALEQLQLVFHFQTILLPYSAFQIFSYWEPKAGFSLLLQFFITSSGCKHIHPGSAFPFLSGPPINMETAGVSHTKGHSICTESYHLASYLLCYWVFAVEHCQIRSRLCTFLIQTPGFQEPSTSASLN